MDPQLFRQNGVFPQMLANAAALLEQQKRTTSPEPAAPQSPSTSVETPPSSHASVKTEANEADARCATPPTSSNSTPPTKESPKQKADEKKVARKGGFGVSDLLNK